MPIEDCTLSGSCLSCGPKIFMEGLWLLFWGIYIWLRSLEVGSLCYLIYLYPCKLPWCELAQLNWSAEVQGTALEYKAPRSKISRSGWWGCLGPLWWSLCVSLSGSVCLGCRSVSASKEQSLLVNFASSEKLPANTLFNILVKLTASKQLEAA